MTSFRAY